MSKETKATSIRLDRILFLRGQRVVLDGDLTVIFEVTPKRLNEQIRRNIERFPDDFLFQLSDQEFADLRSQFSTSSSSYGTLRSHGGKKS